MVAGADGPHEPVDVGTDRPRGVAAALGQIQRRDEEDRVTRGRQRYRLGRHEHVLGKTAMLTPENTPELSVSRRINRRRDCAAIVKAARMAGATGKDVPMTPISRGFGRRRQSTGGDAARVPPGQYLTDDFPVLSAGPTPHADLEEWGFIVSGEVDDARSWTWDEFQQLPQETVTVDIHCVTKWSKLDTTWTGVSVDTLLDGVETSAEYVTAWSQGGYTTNLPLEDLLGGKAWVAFEYDDEPLEPEHGGPARLLVPHLYFWKSAKWVRGLELKLEDEPGFWESYGYHNYGDPWQEQRYYGD